MKDRLDSVLATVVAAGMIGLFFSLTQISDAESEIVVSAASTIALLPPSAAGLLSPMGCRGYALARSDCSRALQQCFLPSEQYLATGILHDVGAVGALVDHDEPGLPHLNAAVLARRLGAIDDDIVAGVTPEAEHAPRP